METVKFTKLSKEAREHLVQLEAQLPEIALNEQQKKDLVILNNQLSAVTKELETLKWNIENEIEDFDPINEKSC